MCYTSALLPLQLDALTVDLEAATSAYEELSRQREDLQAQINNGLYEKQRRTQAVGETLKQHAEVQTVAMT